MSCYIIRLRRATPQGRLPYSEKGGDDAFVMYDIGRKVPATIVKLYAATGVHVVHMIKIPDWEGPTI